MEHHSQNNTSIHNTSPTRVWSYWPIAAIYLASSLFAFYTIAWHIYPDYMSHVMGFVLILFGIIKLTDIAGFAYSFSQYDPLAKQSMVYAQIYPFLEIFLGTLFILQLFVLPTTLLTLFIYSASFYGALKSVRKKETLHCVCLGTYFRLPLSKVTFIEAGFMVAMCIWMILMISTMDSMVM